MTEKKLIFEGEHSRYHDVMLDRDRIAIVDGNAEVLFEPTWRTLSELKQIVEFMEGQSK